MSAEFDPLRAITALRALDADSGGRRIAWTADWERARAWLRGELAGIPGVQERTDEAGNLWARLPGRSPDTVVLGSHLDCVPNGGWLDGALGVVAALEALRTIAADPEPPDRSVALVDWADEEGARFGHSLLGSSAAAGLLDVPAVSALRDRDGIALPDVLAAHGVAVARMPDARASLDGVIAYLELHIEQGPVLERTGRPCAAVDGCLGVRRTLVTFTGEAGHAGATPMDGRRDPVQAAVAYVPLMTAAATGARASPRWGRCAPSRARPRRSPSAACSRSTCATATSGRSRGSLPRRPASPRRRPAASGARRRSSRCGGSIRSASTTRSCRRRWR